VAAPRSGNCLAIDVGGTKVDVAIVGSDVTIRRRERILVSEHPHDLTAAILSTARALSDHAEVECVGVASPGPMAASGEFLSPINIAQWRDEPLREKLVAALNLPVNIDGDVRALARAEGAVGSAQGLDNYFSLVVSTGIGGAIVCDGRLLDGTSGNAGHLGHVIVVPDGAHCTCGARGCLEAEASGWAIAQSTGVDPRDADEASRRHCAVLVGRGVGTLASVLDISQCFVAGSVALGFGEEFFDTATRSAREVATMAYSRDVTISPSGLGGDGPLLGAALLGWEL
jgi:glucokinase